MLQNSIYHDERGFFNEIYRKDELAVVDIRHDFTQLNHSYSNFGVLRGLHAQSGQAKLIWVSGGEIFDVAVDLRRSSEYFGQWVSEILSGQNHRMIWIPPGFGHAFMVLSNEAEIEYRMTNSYAPEHERTIRWDDPDIGIEWPENRHGKPFVSRKDSQALLLKDAELYD